MVIVHNKKELAKAIDNGETEVMAGNLRMERALDYVSSHKDISTNDIATLTAVVIIVCSLIAATTAVAIIALLKNRNVRVTVETDGDKKKYKFESI